MMSQYATLYAFSRIFNKRAVISQHMSDTLLRVFPSISIPAIKCKSDYNWTISNAFDLSKNERLVKLLHFYRNLQNGPTKTPSEKNPTEIMVKTFKILTYMGDFYISFIRSIQVIPSTQSIHEIFNVSF